MAAGIAISPLMREEIFNAMLSRGFSGSIHIHSFRKLKLQDLSVGVFFFLTGVLFLWI
jgi:energy-coupling factor transporter transmembrane protein EcfT